MYIKQPAKLLKITIFCLHFLHVSGGSSCWMWCYYAVLQVAWLYGHTGRVGTKFYTSLVQVAVVVVVVIIIIIIFIIIISHYYHYYYYYIHWYIIIIIVIITQARKVSWIWPASFVVMLIWAQQHEMCVISIIHTPCRENDECYFFR